MNSRYIQLESLLFIVALGIRETWRLNPKFEIPNSKLTTSFGIFDFELGICFEL